MKISEFLNEEFDEPTSFIKANKNTYIFNIGRELIYTCEFEEINKKDIPYKKITDLMKNDNFFINFSFSANFEKKNIKGGIERKETQDMTGTGHVKKVFSTIIDIIKDYINSNKPKYLLFLGDKEHFKFYKFVTSNLNKYTNDYMIKKIDEKKVPNFIFLERK
jgi:hypothetical protein